MCVYEAKQIASDWVRLHGSATSGFTGAFVHGSVNWQPDDALLPATSDLDVMLVLADEAPPPKPGKLVYRDVLLEISYLPAASVQTPQQVLAEYNLAGSFHTPSVLLDPTGHLTRLQAAVAAEYAQRHWVRARSQQALHKVETGLARLHVVDLFHDRVIAWLFSTGVMTHVLLVAGLKDPTVRTRYVAARDLLAEYGRLDYCATLLSLLGCDDMTQDQAEMHLDALACAFDDAAAVIRTPFPFASDISELARPIAIDGSRDLIVAGRHREAVFWLVATFSRCMAVFHHDTPAAMHALVSAHAAAYRRLLADVGIASSADLHRRAGRALAVLPELWSVAEEIMAANPDIQVQDKTSGH